ncbi:MAG: hypothetical protein O3C09_00860 [Proteobacteria bacterium]|nr:hypothetical protein [Pseudomonadota bacterium]
MNEAATRFVRPVGRQAVERLSGAFDDIVPWAGPVEADRLRSFMGGLFPADVRSGAPSGNVETRRPDLSDGEGFAEWYSILKAIERARDRFTMVSLGAHYGGLMVDAVCMLRARSPMPYRLIGVEADPYMCALVHEHFAENDIPESALTLINAAIAADNKPVLFPVAPTRTGAARALTQPSDIKTVFQHIFEGGHAEKVLAGLLTEGKSAVFQNLSGTDVNAELRLSSAVTLADVIGPLDRVDYLEIDIQSSELQVLPPFIDLLRSRVGWIHLGTHGVDLHRTMAAFFRGHGFDIHIDWEPNSTYSSPDGILSTGDGVLAMANAGLD